MKILPEPLVFDWDTGNKDKNIVKHKVTNKEVEEVFQNRPKFILEDAKHSEIEERYLLLGVTNKGKHLAVIFTIRGDKVRPISNRPMNKKERRFYEEKTQANTNI